MSILRSRSPLTSSRTPRIASVLVALAVGASPVSLRAQSIYKSVDPQGHTVFSDRPQGPGAKQEVLEDAASPPKMAHFCWTNCFTLVESHGIYARVDGTDETWTVERFTRTSFVLMRHDPPAEWNRFKTQVPYAGRVVGEKLVDVTVDGLQASDIRMAWGSALDSLPGSNTERDSLQAQGLWPPDHAQQAGGPLPSESAQFLTTATEAPPPLPSEEQPPCEVEGTIWKPGYWAWTASVYYWAPGAWVHPPRVELLWTPGYWKRAGGGLFVFHPGFWGPVVGDYGGINYGHGYSGAGYSGGRWLGDRFHYNTAVSNVDASVIRNVYREPVPAGFSVSRVSYLGGPSGTASRVTYRAQAAVAKQPGTVQPGSNERTPQAASNGLATPTPHHNRKSRSSTAPRVAQNSASNHSQANAEAPATSKTASSTPAKPSRASH
jgi:hypothetical protein